MPENFKEIITEHSKLRYLNQKKILLGKYKVFIEDWDDICNVVNDDDFNEFIIDEFNSTLERINREIEENCKNEIK